jgi:membrane fusion protein (multidrug efflux system)
VRIALDARQLAEHPLRIGLSMRAEIDLHNQQGNPMGTIKEAAEYQLDTPSDKESQARIDAIIAANLK